MKAQYFFFLSLSYLTIAFYFYVFNSDINILFFAVHMMTLVCYLVFCLDVIPVYLFFCSTHDDSYMLFGALFSGYSCMFMSKDYFRDSKHRLGTKHGEIFQKWQRSRQVSLLTKAYNDHFTVLVCISKS